MAEGMYSIVGHSAYNPSDILLKMCCKISICFSVQELIRFLGKMQQ